MSLWHSIGRQLRSPCGFAGRLAGGAMRVVNAKPNNLAIAALEIDPQDSILELGFGPGHAIALMALQLDSGMVHGIDGSSTMLEVASQRNRRAIDRGQVSLQLGSFELLPFPDSSIDKVLAVNVVYFWRDAQAILQEIRRILRPGGRLAIYATDAATMQDWKFAGPDSHRLFHAAELCEILLSGGFERYGVTVRSVRLTKHIHGLIATADGPPETRGTVGTVENDPSQHFA